MSGKVVSLAEHRPHLSGKARCMCCRHEWVAVAPVGTTELDCPSCGTSRGVWVHVMAPNDGTVWRCSCGNDFFLLLPSGAPMCAACGLRATSWADG